MTKGNSRYLIIFISLALIGSIGVQIWLFSNALEVRRAKFKSEVLEAMRNAGEQIEGVDDMKLIESEMSFRPWLQEQIPNVFSVIDSNTQTSSPMDPYALESPVQMLNDAGIESDVIDSGSFYTFRYQADTTFFSPSGPFRVEVSQEGAGQRSEDGKIKLYVGQLQRVEERVLHMDTVLQTFVRSSVRDWVPIDTRFKADEIDSIIRAELDHKGLDVQYEYAIKEGDYLTNLKSDSFKEPETAFKVPIFRDDLWGSPRYLMIQIPGGEAYLYRGMWFMFTLSLLFTIGVIITFWSTIRQMLQQKKINRIKNDFINNMTHEFKTPLATINLAIDALNSPKISGDKSRQEHYTNIIRKENERMHKQVERVLQMSLLDKDEIELKREVVSVDQWIEDAINHMELTIEGRGGKLSYTANPELFVEIDRHHMSNVLINILDNAVKYSMDAPEVDIHAKVHQGNLRVSVKDKGIGMSKEVRDHIFDRFYRAERGNVHTVKGHGLGLAYAKEIVLRHGGEIEVKSSVGAGSTFIITLALASPSK